MNAIDFEKFGGNCHNLSSVSMQAMYRDADFSLAQFIFIFRKLVIDDGCLALFSRRVLKTPYSHHGKNEQLQLRFQGCMKFNISAKAHRLTTCLNTEIFLKESNESLSRFLLFFSPVTISPLFGKISRLFSLNKKKFVG